MASPLTVGPGGVIEMSTYSTSMTTPRPPEDAFGYLADVRNFALWDPGVREAHAPADQVPGTGATYDLVVKVGPGSTTLSYQVTEFEPPTRVVLLAETRALRSLDEIRVEPHGSGALVTYDAELTLRGAARVASPFLSLAFKRVGDRAAAGLARALNAEIVGAR